MRHLQRRMAHDINTGGYDVAYLRTYPVQPVRTDRRMVERPTVFYAQEARRVGFEAPMPPPVSQARRRKALIRLLRPPYELVCRRRDRRAVGAVDLVLCNSYFSADVLTATYGSTRSSATSVSTHDVQPV